MVKPPGDPGRRRIFEVDDRVLVSIKILFIEQRTGAMDQSGELEIDIGTDTLAVKAGKQRRRSSAVKTFAVKEDPYFQKTCPRSLQYGVLVKLLEMTLLSRNVKKLTSSPSSQCCCNCEGMRSGRRNRLPARRPITCKWKTVLPASAF